MSEPTAARICQNIDAATQAAIDLVRKSGVAYKKKPGLGGFHAYYSDDPNHVVHNKLEDITYQGKGFYVVGLVGEVWRVGSFEQLSASYVLDSEGAGDLELSRSLLAKTRPPKDGNLSSCLRIKYRPVQATPILAARALPNMGAIQHRSSDGRIAPMRINAPTTTAGERIEHGLGDMVACPLRLAPRTELSAPNVTVDGNFYTPNVNGLYVINGEVFDRTYIPAAMTS